ncbi:hypothetical protein IW262DRAFT_1293955 [Armillaria fumosa]|nr:hypothetical protein IW262DRAFT_1293955 [Armillaria fumosa]
MPAHIPRSYARKRAFVFLLTGKGFEADSMMGRGERGEGEVGLKQYSKGRFLYNLPTTLYRVARKKWWTNTVSKLSIWLWRTLRTGKDNMLDAWHPSPSGRVRSFFGKCSVLVNLAQISAKRNAETESPIPEELFPVIECVWRTTHLADDEWSLDVDALPNVSGKLLVLCVNKNCVDMRKLFLAVAQEHGLPSSCEIF